jgi:hypothetical protein
MAVGDGDDVALNVLPCLRCDRVARDERVNEDVVQVLDLEGAVA